MSKLRRHDGRNHRAVECNLCGVMLESRQEISQHRQTEHQMDRKMYCKFFPECIDGDECLFEHKTAAKQGCVNGESCSDQSCQYSENSHKDVRNVLFRFQANCNRLNCVFKHNVERKAFLGACFSNLKRK